MRGGSREVMVGVSDSGFNFHPILLPVASFFFNYVVSVGGSLRTRYRATAIAVTAPNWKRGRQKRLQLHYICSSR